MNHIAVVAASFSSFLFLTTCTETEPYIIASDDNLVEIRQDTFWSNADAQKPEVIAVAKEACKTQDPLHTRTEPNVNSGYATHTFRCQ